MSSLFNTSRSFLPAVGLACLLSPIVLGIFGCGKPEGTKPTAGPGEKGTSAPEAAPGVTPAKEAGSADEVLQAMVKAYQSAKTYSDEGSVRLIIDTPQGKTDDKANFSIVFERPNRVKLNLYQAELVSDGKTIQAKISELPGQVRVKNAPDRMTLEDILIDPLLAQVMTQGQAGLSLPLVMLMGKDDPLSSLLKESEKPSLAEPGEIGGKACYRVKLRRPEGTAIFWIDKENFTLRRINLPTDAFFEMIRQQAPVTSVSVTAEFAGATLNGKVDPAAFVFNRPADAQEVKFFVPPHPAQLLGKTAPELKFTDLDGKTVSLSDMAGKVCVFEFWATWCGPCRKSLPIFAKTVESFKGNDKIAMFAVSVDAPQVDNAELKTAFEKLNVDVPILRDSSQLLMRNLRTAEIPSIFVVDAKGVVQYFEIIGNPELAAALPDKLKQVLAGEDIYQEPLKGYQKDMAAYEAKLERMARGEKADGTTTEEKDIPRADVAPASPPMKLKLTSLWTCKDLKAPGNIMVVAGAGGASKIFAVEALKGVAELGPDGKAVARHPFRLDDTEVISALRTAVGADGKRYYAAFASAQQRFHLLDENWNLLFSFPQDALENKHDGIADVELGDLNGDGVIEAYAGYWGVVGVQAVSLEGKRIAANRKLSDVVRCAISGPDREGLRGLFCANRKGNLSILDSKLEQVAERVVRDRLLTWIVSASLTDNPNLDWCGLTSPRLGENIAIGIDLDGQEQWTYPLPEGVHSQPIEPVIPGQLGGKTGQWLLPGSDGSIHIVSPDGTPVERFNYGKALSGLATVKIDGKPVLIVATPEGIEALRVE